MVGFNGIRNASARAGAGALAALAFGLAGCATQTPPPMGAGELSALYVGADRLNAAAVNESQERLAQSGPVNQGASAADQVAAPSPTPWAAAGAPIHAGYVAAETGPCGPYAKIEQGETLGDVAAKCGVSKAALAAYNPGIDAPGLAAAGAFVAIPPAGASAGSIASAGATAFGWYVARDGDTLQTVAASHLATPADLIRLNPGLDWDSLAPGSPVRVPAAYGAPTPASIARKVIRDKSAGGPGYVYPVSPSVTNVMPYSYKPATPAAPGGGQAPSELGVDRRVVAPGGKVVVSGENLPPNSEISLYRGANGREMQYVGSVRTDAKGAFSNPIRVEQNADLGGVIFKATVDKTGQALQSPRVGVDTLHDSGDLQEIDDDQD